MKSLMKNGLFYMKKILADITKNGITGADDHSDSTERLNSEDIAFEENKHSNLDNIFESYLTRYKSTTEDQSKKSK
jgi:hypothetical protein